MKRFIAVVMCILLAVCCASCQKNEDKKEDTQNTTQATINPLDIVFGYDKQSQKADRWYLTGTDDVVYIYFTTENEEELCTYNLVKSGVVTESAVCVTTQDNHLIPKDITEASFDLVFKDNFNVYDCSTDSTYSRGNAKEYEAYFSDAIFITENGEKGLFFYNDKTFAEFSNTTATSDSLEPEYLWEVVSPKNIRLTTNGEQLLCELTYNDDMSLNSIEYKGDIYYAQYSENSPSNKYKAY